MAEGVKQSAIDTLYSGYVGQGEKVEEFENAIAAFVKHHGVCAVNSGTSALSLAYNIIKQATNGKEVLTTPLTCMATNIPLVTNGFAPKWVDVDPKTCNIDLVDLRRKLTKDTCAVVVVHWGGYPVDLDELEKINREFYGMYSRRFVVVEDAAHAFGSVYKDAMIGSHGSDFCAFSFGPIKHLTTTDGGCLMTLNGEKLRIARSLRWYGINRDSRDAPVYTPGFKYNMNDVAASIGIENLKNIPKTLEITRRNAKMLRSGLASVPGLTLLEESPGFESSYWLFTIKVDRVKEFQTKMKSLGIESGPVHTRNDHAACFYMQRAFLPGMDELQKTMTCIPCGWWMAEDDVQYVIESIKSGW